MRSSFVSTANQKTGQRGEELAADHLRHNGYVIITTNWHCKVGEIDIVANKDDVLVFVEVRTRHAATTESALESITPSKRQKMINSAYTYVNANDLPSETFWRIDVIAVALDRSGSPIIDHVEDALGW
jgi:putative endonuclease